MNKSIVALLLAIAAFGFSVTTASATTYYVAPTGSDTNSGTSSDEPWGTFNRAWQDLYPGDTLILMDGVYYQTLNPNRRNGEPGNPISIRAQNDGKAIIEGEHIRPTVKLGDTWPGPIGSHFVIEGIIAQNSSGAVYEIRGDYNTLRRVSGYNANTDLNAHVITIWANHNLVEDCIAAGTGRKMILIFQKEYNTIRRCLAQWEAWDGRNWCDHWPWGDNIEIYNASHNLIENSIGYGGVPAWSISVQANADTATAAHNRVLGTMAVNAGMGNDGKPTVWGASRPGPTECTSIRDLTWPSQRVGFMQWGQGELENNVFRDIFAWGNAGLGFSTRRPYGIGPQNSVIDHATIVNNGLDAPPNDGGQGTNVMADQIGMYRVTNSRIHGTAYDDEGARLGYRYLDGVLTDVPLWPWPMEDRVQAELGFSITERMLPLLAAYGAIDSSFIVAATPPTVSMNAGQSVAVIVSVNTHGTYTSPVTLIARVDSEDLKIEPESVLIDPPGQAVFMLQDVYAGTGTTDRQYEIAFTGQADGTVKNTSVSALVTYPTQVGSFNLLTDPISVTLDQGASSQIEVAVEYVHGLSGEVQIAAESSSPHLLVSPSEITLAASGKTTLALEHVDSSILPSTVTYQILVTATHTPDTGAPIQQTKAVDVEVRPKELSKPPVRTIFMPITQR